MMGHDHCPTCGTKLNALRGHERVRACTSCQRPNPRGFHYCGFCAAPMENTDLRGRIAKVAAPPGGWPSLARELLEVRFFLERGDVGEAFEMVQLLRQRWPGHPQLEEFHGMSPTTRPKRVHTGVNEVVDAVLAGSADWAARAPRRAAPKWQAPAAPSAGRGRTQAHEVVDAPSEGGVRKRVEDGSGLRERDTRRGYRSVAAHPVVPVINPAFRDSGPQRITQDDDTAVFHRAPKMPQRAEAEPAGAGRVTAPQLVPPEPPPGLTDGLPHLVAAAGSLDAAHDDGVPPPVARVEVRASAPASRDASVSGDRTVVGPPPTRGAGWSPPRGLTMAVDALQPPRPFDDDEGDAQASDDEEIDTVRRAAKDDADAPPRRKVRGKAQGKKKAKRKPVPIENDDDPDSAEKREAKAKRRAAKFGQSIVGR